MTVSVKSWAVLNSRFKNNIFGWLFFRFVFGDRNPLKIFLASSFMANYLFPGKPRQITKPIYFFDVTSTWVGKGRTLPATLICFLWFFCHLEHLWNNLWQGIIHWRYIFLVVFIFVCENGTVSEWVSHNNEERTIKLIQDIRRHLLIIVECHWTLPRTAMHDCTGSISLTGEFAD